MNEPFSLFLLGIFYGTTVCSFSCLPYFGPYLIGTGTGFKDGLVSSFSFATGKLFIYSVLGGMAALLGKTLVVTPTHKMMLGMLLIAVAVTIPFVTKNGCLKRNQVVTKRFSMFILGMVSSFMPCPPLAAVFALAIQQGNVQIGLLYGFSYGLGMMVSPILLAGGGFSLMSQKIRQEVSALFPHMQKLSIAVMIVIAVKMMY